MQDSPWVPPVQEEKGASVAELCISSPHLACSPLNIGRRGAGHGRDLGEPSCSLLCCHTPARASGLEVQQEMGNSCHFFSDPCSKKISSQDADLPGTLRLAKESTRVGVFLGKDRGSTG